MHLRCTCDTHEIHLRELKLVARPVCTCMQPAYEPLVASMCAHKNQLQVTCGHALQLLDSLIKCENTPKYTTLVWEIYWFARIFLQCAEMFCSQSVMPKNIYMRIYLFDCAYIARYSWACAEIFNFDLLSSDNFFLC